MDLSSVNWLAVIACVVISMISGSIWYNPKTFFSHLVGGSGEWTLAARHGEYGHDLGVDGPFLSRASICNGVHGQCLGG